MRGNLAHVNYLTRDTERKMTNFLQVLDNSTATAVQKKLQECLTVKQLT